MESRARLFVVASLCLIMVFLSGSPGHGRPCHAPGSRIALNASTPQGAASVPGQPRGSDPRTISFRHVTLDDGLSQSSITCIVQDGDGFMWFGTQDGLNRYDGYEITIFRHDRDDPSSLSSNAVVRCKRDQRDQIWFLTADGTIHRRDAETGRFIRYTPDLDDPFQEAGRGFTSVLADSRGRVWIGTYGSGLLRYDPDDDAFTTFRHDPQDPTSLSHRCVWTLHEGRGGSVWVGTEGGLSRYDEDRDAFVRYPYRDFPPGGYQYDPPVHDYDPAFQPENEHAMGSPGATAIADGPDGDLWIGTRYGGLNRLDLATGRFAAYPYDPAREPADPHTFSGNSVRSMLVDQAGALWVASAHWHLNDTRTYERLGLERLDPDAEIVTRFAADAEDPCSLPHDATLHIHEDSRGTLWFHTFGGGVEVYDRTTGCFVHHAHEPNDPTSLSGDTITAFYEDEAGGLWLGTAVNGVNLYDPTWAKFPAYAVTASGGERLSNNSVWAFGLSNPSLDVHGRAHGLWVSTSAGLNYWDRRQHTFTYYEIDPQLPDVQAFALLEDADRRVLWMATNMGLERAALPNDLSPPPDGLDITRVLTRSSASSGVVLDLEPAGPDRVWLAHHGVGLSLFDLASEQVVTTYTADLGEPSALTDSRVNKLYPGRNGHLWIATATGLTLFDSNAETFEDVLGGPDEPLATAERIISLWEQSEDAVWMGTNGEGLWRLDPETGEVTARYGVQDGLPNGVIYHILPDDGGQLWLSTNLGLARFDPTSETFECFTSAEGLQSNEFNQGAGLAAPDGEIFLGGVSGINAFYPGEIVRNPYVPPVVITEIRLGPPDPSQNPATSAGLESDHLSQTGGGQDALLEAPPETTSHIEVSYRDRVLSFEFAALHFAMPERNEYAYRMEGFDQGWNYVGNRRFATYTNLPPGKYRFQVKGSNSDGIWNEEGASLAVTVTPPFWATWWFRGLGAALVLAGVAAAYRVRSRSIRARSRALASEVALRTKELAAINTVSSVVSRSLDLDATLADALDQTLDVLGIGAGGIYLLDDDRATLNLAVSRGLSTEFTTDIDGLAVGEGFSGRVVESGEPLIVEDVSKDSRLTRAVVRREGMRSLIVVPLGAKGRVLGTLFVVTTGHRSFTDRNLELLTSIGHQIGVAVENARLYEDTRRRLAQLSALQETTTAVAGTLELKRLLRLIVDDAVALLRAEGGILNLVDWEARLDEVVAASGVASNTIGRRASLDAGLSGWVALRDEAVASNDVLADPRINRNGMEWLESGGYGPVRNAAVVPLRIKKHVVGTLVIVDKERGEADFDDSDVDLLQAFANQAATAIENARLFEAEQRRAEQFRVITEVGRRITSLTNLDAVLRQLAQLIHSAFGYDHVGIAVTEGDYATYRVGAGRLWESDEFEFSPSSLRIGEEGITGWVASTGEPLLVPDVREDPRYVWMHGSDTLSELAVPIKLKGQVIGVLDAQSGRVNGFDESDLSVLQSLADQAAIAIENARLYEQASRVAVVEERQRLARELHDSVTQALYGTTLYAEAATRQLANGQMALVDEHLRELRDTAQEALREMRLLIFELRPSVLEGEGLVPALRARLEAVEERAGLTVAFRVEGDGIIVPAPVEEGLYRIAQEALNNALKHACARRVEVSLELAPDRAVLEIVDDGCGFEPSTAVEGGGLGLDGMIERAEKMGGELILDSAPDAGTRVRVEVTYG